MATYHRVVLGATLCIAAYTSAIFAVPLPLRSPSCAGWFGYCGTPRGINLPFGGVYTRAQVALLALGLAFGLAAMLAAARKEHVPVRWLAPAAVLAGVVASAYLLGTLWEPWPRAVPTSVAWTLARRVPLIGLSLGPALVIVGKARGHTVRG